MPLVAAAYLALVAGLLAGFGGLAAAATVAAAAAALLAGLRRDAGAAAVALVVACGALAAYTARRSDASCRAGAARAGHLVVALSTSAAPGALARGQVVGLGCPLPATLAVDAGGAAAGAVVWVSGRAAPAGRGVHVRDAVVTPSGRTAVLPGLRDRARRAIDRLFGADAPVARALLVADATEIPPDVRDRYADAGLVHLLSVSGLHVAIIAAAVELLLAAARVGPERAAAASVVAVAAYVALLGAPAPAVRAAVMLGAAAASRALQRPTSPWAPVALGGLAPLVDPRQVLDLGYQLSVAGVAALVAGGTLVRRRLAEPGRPALRGWRRAVVRDLAASVAATLVTAPIVAWHFGRLSLVGPLANLAAAPVVALLQPALFVALLLEPAGAPARFVADGARVLLRALDAVAAAASRVPGSALAVAPTLWTAVLLGGAAAGLVVACVARRPARAVLVAAACVAVAAWAPLVPTGSGHAELHVLDVGQGDAVALRSPGGRWVLFDAGRVWRGGDAGRRTVVPYLRARRGRLVAFVLSHAHADHVGGAATVLRALRPAQFVDAAFVLGSSAYRDALGAARDAGVRWRRARPGDSLVVDGVVIEFLAPDSTWTASLDDPNSASVVASVRYGEVRFLLVGDAEAPEERWLLDRARTDTALAARLRADVLKVGHHGSATSSTAPFVAAVAPRVALVSVGAGNQYGHPSADVIARLRGAGAAVVRTDLAGTVVVRTDGRSLDVHAGEGSWAAPSRSLDAGGARRGRPGAP